MKEIVQISLLELIWSLLKARLNFNQAMESLFQKRGKVFKMPFGILTNISSVEVFSAIQASNKDVEVRINPLPGSKIPAFFDLIIDNVGALNGTEWEKAHSGFMRAYTPRIVLSQYKPIIEGHVEELVAYLEDKANGRGFDPTADIFRWQFDLLTRISIGIHPRSLGKGQNPFFQAMIVDTIAGVFHPLKPHRFFRAKATILQTFDEAYASCLADPEAYPDCALKVLIQANQQLAPGDQMGKQRMMSNLFSVYRAGLAGGVGIISWVLTSIGFHPDVQERCRQEALSIRETGTAGPDPSKTTLINALIKEVIRLWPPIAFLVPRRLNATIQTKNYTIPAQTWFLLWTAPIQRDSELWGESAHHFIPERFIKGSAAYQKPLPYSIAAFGAGKRSCMGMQVTHLIMDTMVQKLLLRFQIRSLGDGNVTTPGNQVRPLSSFQFFLQRPDNFRISLQKLSHEADLPRSARVG